MPSPPASACCRILALLTLCAPLPARTFDVGPGQALDSIGQVPWSELRAGDTVRIHYRPEPYREKVLISSRGTAGNPIRVIGVPGPQGQLPVIQGANATTGSNMQYRWANPIYQEGLGLVEIGYRRDGPKPGFIEISKLEITGARPEQAFTTSGGKVMNYRRHACCVRIFGGENVTLSHLRVHDCDNGIFAKSQSNEQFVTRNLTIENSEIFGNGRPKGYPFVHNIYVESDGVLIQGNRLGMLVPGSSGAIIKDRSAGTVIRYNHIASGARMLDLVEPEDGAPMLTSRPTYPQTFVYGNIFDSNAAERTVSTRPIHYGGDLGVGTERKGTLFFYHNTFVIVANQAEGWKSRIFDVTSKEAAVDLRNNIFANFSRTGAGRVELDFSTGTGRFVFGPNWVSPGWRMRFKAEGPFAGTVTGEENIVSPPDNDPKFVDLVKGDFRLRPDSSAMGKAGALAAAATDNALGQKLTVNSQLQAPAGTCSRDAAADRAVGALGPQ